MPPSMLEGLGSDIAKVANTLRYKLSVFSAENMLANFANFEIVAEEHLAR